MSHLGRTAGGTHTEPMPVDRAQLASIIEWLSVLATRHPDLEHRSSAAALATRLSRGRRGLQAIIDHSPERAGVVPTVTLSTFDCLDISAALDDTLPLVDVDDARDIALLQLALDLAIPYDEDALA